MRAMPRDRMGAATQEQIDFWNGPAAERWVRSQADLDFSLAPLGLAAMDAAQVRPGERVVDVGCGTGATTVELAKRVGPGGAVLGLDLSAPMLERAKERAAGLSHVRFAVGDASTHALERGGWDVLFSRFGVMFFNDPRAAFESLARGLREGGRVAFVCWRAVGDNPWAKVPVDAVASILPPPPPEPPDAPGPFAFGDATRVRRVLEGAGLHDVSLAPLDTSMALGTGRGLTDAVRYAMQIGVIARRVADADDATRARVEEALARALAPHATPEGVRMGAACWVVTARR